MHVEDGTACATSASGVYHLGGSVRGVRKSGVRISPLSAAPCSSHLTSHDLCSHPQAGENRYPYAVSLQDEVGHFCGGALIARDAVLTAAHCVWDDAPFQVRVGSDAVYEGGELLDVDEVVVHPLNDPDTDRYDLSLVFTRDLASPDLALVRPNGAGAVPAAGETAVAMGWGDTEATADPVDLHDVRLEIITNRECAAATDGTLSYAEWIYDDMLCTFTPNRDAW